MRGVAAGVAGLCLLISGTAYADRCYQEKGPLYTVGAFPQTAFYDKFLTEPVPMQVLDPEKGVITEPTRHEFINFTVCEIDGGEKVARWVPEGTQYQAFMPYSKLYARPGMYATEMLTKELRDAENKLQQGKGFMPSAVQKQIQERIRQLLRIPGISRR